MMAVMQHARLHAVPLLSIGRIGFAADVIIDSCRGHQIAFVGGVDEHFSRISLPAKHRDGGEASAGLFHALGAVEPFVAMDDCGNADRSLQAASAQSPQSSIEAA